MSLKDRKRSDELLNRLGIECVENKILERKVKMVWAMLSERRRIIG